MVPTFASFLTPAGIIVAAALVTGTIEVVKQAFPTLDAKVSGAALAFFLTAVLYVLTGAATGVVTPDAGLAVFASWLACASSAIGIKSAYDHLGDRVAVDVPAAAFPPPLLPDPAPAP